MWLLLSIYASESLEIGGNFSRLYATNSLFVRRIVVTNRTQAEGLIVYGFSETPALDQEIDWTEEHTAIVSSNHHQEWAFWLNQGSQIALQYNITDPSMELMLVVIQGEENMQKWIQNVNNSDLVSSWKIAQGVGSLQHEVERDHKYYFGLGNIQSSSVEVTLQITFQSKVYNKGNYTSQCYLTSETCAVNLRFLGSDVLLLTAPQTDQGITNGVKFGNERFMQQVDPWSVSIAFEQRWMTYLVFWGAMAIVMLILLVFCRPASQDIQESAVEAAPLTPSNEVEEKVTETEVPLSWDFDEEENAVSEDYLCIICFEARRNCFFDPCGHCATCYTCSMKISKQKKSVCPLCRQPIRFVRKLFLL